MKIFFLMVVFYVPLTGFAAPNDHKIQSHGLGPDKHEVVITTHQSLDLITAQSAVMPTVKKLCGKKEIQFWQHQFDANMNINSSDNEPLQTFSLIMNIECGVVEYIPAPVTSSSLWQPTEQDQAAVEHLTNKYFRDKDNDKYQNAYLMLAISMKLAGAADHWQTKARAFNAKAGKVIKRKIVKISWYNNPHSSPRPGLYARVDYVSQFENIDIHCGHLTWKHEKKDRYHLVGEAENYIDKITQVNMKEGYVEKSKAQFACVF